MSVDFVTGRYESSVVPFEQAEDCFEIRKKVFGGELKRSERDAAFSPAECDEFDEKSEHAIVRDSKTNEVVGCLRLTIASEMLRNSVYEKEYRMDLIPEEILEQTLVLSRFAMLKTYRQTSASLNLLLFLFERGMNDGYLMSLITSEAALYPLYRRFGYRPLASIHLSPYGGYRVPLFLMGHDFEYLRSVKSPIFNIIKKRKFPIKTKALDWYKEHESDFMDPGFTILPDTVGHSYSNLIMNEVSESGKKQLLNKGVLVKCNYGDKVIIEGAGERNFGFVQNGGLQIIRGGKIVAILGKGDLFGELAFMLNIPRTANAIAASDDTEVVFLSLSCINRLKDANDRAVLWRNISHVLAHRLAAKF